MDIFICWARNALLNFQKAHMSNIFISSHPTLPLTLYLLSLSWKCINLLAFPLRWLFVQSKRGRLNNFNDNFLY